MHVVLYRVMDICHIHIMHTIKWLNSTENPETVNMFAMT